MRFLDEVVAQKRDEVECLRKSPPPMGLAEPLNAFETALYAPGLSVIAEIKRRSPSKGDLAPNLDARKKAKDYRDGGAAAVSCLTDRRFFGARATDFAEACAAGLPVLRKDFIIDPLQVDESRAMGAAAILLIVRILEPAQLQALLDRARLQALDALVEVHDEYELERALAAGASLIGVNNRNLSTLEVDPARALKLRPRIPKGVLCVAESGVKTREDVRRIEDAGFDAVLIGETLSTAKDPAERIRELTRELKEAL